MSSTSSSERVLLPTSVSPIHYAVHFTPKLTAPYDFSAVATIKLRVSESNIREIVLNAFELVFSAADVTLDGAIATHVDFDVTEQRATLRFANTLNVGESVLVIHYQGTHNDKMVGFYRSTYDGSNGVKKVMVTTQFEATDARRAIPCWDEPARKATWAITLTIDASLTCVSNMPVVAEMRDATTSTKTVQFDSSPVMSSYLVAFVVGEFEYIEAATEGGIPMRVYTTPGKKEQGAFALDFAAKVLHYFNTYYGIPYPLPKMDLIAIPDFAAGAMENYGCVTFRETALLWDSKESSAASKQRVAYVVAHELAHQWFGNLVTMQWWDNLWLNEGFATYVGYFAVNKIYPEWDIWTQFVSQEFGRAMALDALRSSHPVEQEVRSAGEIDELFDAVSYSKGCSLIRMLGEYVGEKAFRAGLHSYLTSFSYSNAVTADLWHHVALASGQPVADMMHSWIKIMGYPLVTVELTDGGKSLALSQQRFLVDGSEGEGEWQTPLVITHAGGVMNHLLKSTKETIPLSSSITWLKLNAGVTGFYRTRYHASMFPLVERAIASGTLTAADRLGIISDAFALAKAGYMPTSTALTLLQAYKGERDFTVWQEITANLGSIESLVEDGVTAVDDLRRFKVMAVSLLKEIGGVLGWSPAAGESHKNSMLRSLILGSLCHYEDDDCLAVAKAKFASEEAVHADLRRLIYCVGVGSGKEGFDRVFAIYKNATLNEERVRCLYALGRTNDIDTAQRVLDMSLDKDEVRPQDSIYALSPVASKNPSHRLLVWRFMQKRWPDIVAAFEGSLIYGRIVEACTSGFTTTAMADEIAEFFNGRAVPGVERTIQQSLEGIRSMAAWRERDGADIHAWLKERE